MSIQNGENEHGLRRILDMSSLMSMALLLLLVCCGH